MFNVENPALKLTLIILFLLTRYLVLIYFIWQFSVRKHSYTTFTNCVTLTTNVRSILTYQLYHWTFIFDLEFSRVKSTLCALLSQFKWDLFIIIMCLKKQSVQSFCGTSNTMPMLSWKFQWYLVLGQAYRNIAFDITWFPVDITNTLIARHYLIFDVLNFITCIFLEKESFDSLISNYLKQLLNDIYQI